MRKAETIAEELCHNSTAAGWYEAPEAELQKDIETIQAEALEFAIEQAALFVERMDFIEGGDMLRSGPEILAEKLRGLKP